MSGGSVSDVARRMGVPPRQLGSSRALEGHTFDPESFKVEMIDGKLVVVDIVLGKALGYKDPKDIRELIARLETQLSKLGVLPCRTGKPSELGGRPTKEYLLSAAQVNYASKPLAQRLAKLPATVG